MKFLIWILCFSCNALITNLLRYSGVILGDIPTCILFLITLWTAKFLCRKWDKYKKSQKNRYLNLPSFEYVKENLRNRFLML